jgi:hypothetical protein
MECSMYVNIEGPVPSAGIYIEEASICRASGAMDQHIQAPEGHYRLAYATNGFPGVRHIGRKGQDLAAQCFDFLFHALGEQIVLRKTADGDVRAAKGKLARRRRADSAASTRDQADLSVEFHVLLVAAGANAVRPNRGRRIAAPEVDPPGEGPIAAAL